MAHRDLLIPGRRQIQQTFLQLASDLRQIRTGLSLYNTDGIPKGRRRDLKIPRCRLPLSVKLIVRKFFCQILFCGDIPHPHFIFFKVPIYGYILPLGLIYQGAAIGSAIPWPIFLIIRRILTALGRLIETIEHTLNKFHQSRLPRFIMTIYDIESLGKDNLPVPILTKSFNIGFYKPHSHHLPFS